MATVNDTSNDTILDPPPDGAAATDSGSPTAAGRRRLPEAFLERYAVVITLIALVIVFSVLKPSTFATVGNLQSILTTQAALLVLAVGLTVSLGAGEFDLSIAGVISLSAIIVAKSGSAHGAAAGLLLSLLAAVIVGAVNSFVIVALRANSFIVTLAMGTLLAGIGEGFSGSVTLGDVPDGITNVMTGTWLGIGYPFWITAALAVSVWAFLEHTPTGRYVFFTGEGRRAAQLAGVRVNRMRVMALMVTSLGAWLAGVMLAGQTDAANSTFGDPYLLQAFAGAFLGAATIKAGRFNVLGSVIAVLLLAVGSTGLQLFGLASWVTDVFDGAVLVIAIAFASVVSNTGSR
jgi:ribose transport system permease protein